MHVFDAPNETSSCGFVVTLFVLLPAAALFGYGVSVSTCTYTQYVLKKVGPTRKPVG
jgi:hypothetical protein